ncbi:hypothetical protein [Pseudomonas sp. MWU16-30317]|uniref:hypothetical protein n=1 Tax=Pseudomonas sp. MWU16-30317 TaxID=2878095 RepID=UPI001CFC291B|nr:hypothetical protein [Pseudomonas sp. MWU16-30317]
MKKATRSEEQSSRSQANLNVPDAPNKICRVLKCLIEGRSLNRFEGERIGDHCLHTTISRLANHYSLNFIRVSGAVPNNWGAPCRVIRYSLPTSEHKRARDLLKILWSAAGARREAA